MHESLQQDSTVAKQNRLFLLAMPDHDDNLTHDMQTTPQIPDDLVTKALDFIANHDSMGIILKKMLQGNCDISEFRELCHNNLARFFTVEVFDHLYPEGPPKHLMHISDYVYDGPPTTTETEDYRFRVLADYNVDNDTFIVKPEGLAIVAIRTELLDELPDVLRTYYLVEVQGYINKFINSGSEPKPTFSDKLRNLAASVYIDSQVVKGNTDADEPSLEMATAKALAAALSKDGHSLHYRQGGVYSKECSIATGASGQLSVVDERFAIELLNCLFSGYYEYFVAQLLKNKSTTR